MDNKISVIVPVYNCEDFLEACLESLRGQTYSNFEVILINDGSTDQSAAILEKYAQIDSRFTVLHQENKGPSAARNAGLDIASGQYIYFTDSDDTLEPHLFEKVIHQFEEHKDVDVILFDATPVFEESFLLKKSDVRNYELNMANFYDRSEVLIPDEIISAEQFYITCLYMNKYRANLYLYMMKKRVIDEGRVRFNERIRYYEDVLFFYDASKYIKNMKYIAERLYNRRMTGISLMTSDNHLRIAQALLDVKNEITRLGQNGNRSIAIRLEKFLEGQFLSFWKKCSDEEKNLLIMNDAMCIKLEPLVEYTQLEKQFADEYTHQLKELETILREV